MKLYTPSATARLIAAATVYLAADLDGGQHHGDGRTREDGKDHQRDDDLKQGEPVVGGCLASLSPFHDCLIGSPAKPDAKAEVITSTSGQSR